MGFLSNRIHPSELVAGDHIYSYRKSWGYLFPHHGLFVGGDKVVHFMGDTSFMAVVSRSEISPYCEGCGFHGYLTGVVTSCLSCFLKGGILRRFCYGVGLWERISSVRWVCSMTRSDPLNVVLERARFFENRKTFGVYDVIDNNCVHFVYYCKTGRIFIKDAGGREVIRAEAHGSNIVIRERPTWPLMAWPVLADAFAASDLVSCFVDGQQADHHDAAGSSGRKNKDPVPRPPSAAAQVITRRVNNNNNNASIISPTWAVSLVVLLLKDFTRSLISCAPRTLLIVLAARTPMHET